jgi:uncharacterized phage protein (TIGR02218 family)
MKTIPGPLLAAIRATSTTLATLWVVERTDSEIFYFTDHEKDILFEANLYKASTGYVRSAIASNTSLAVDNMEIDGMAVPAGISEADIRAGLYDYATVTVLLVDYLHLDYGSVQMKKGRLGEITIKDGSFTTELRGVSQDLQRVFIEVVNANCQAEFCDDRCTLNAADFTITDTVSSVTIGYPRKQFTTTSTLDLDVYGGGLVTWLTGDNAGRSMEVKTQAANELTLFLSMYAPIQVGDTFDLIQGCNRSPDRCKFLGNFLNFRGFPQVPGTDRALRIAGLSRL